MIDIDRARALLAARSIAATAAVGAATITPRTDPSAPLSPTQKGLWFASRYEPDSAAYTVPVILRLVGDLDRPALLAAVRELSRRHHVLRSVIRDDGDEPAAVLGPEVDAITVELPAARNPESIFEFFHGCTHGPQPFGYGCDAIRFFHPQFARVSHFDAFFREGCDRRQDGQLVDERG